MNHEERFQADVGGQGTVWGCWSGPSLPPVPCKHTWHGMMGGHTLEKAPGHPQAGTLQGWGF